ncbi:biotin--[acetyl-CoA-carboxylase] ligase [Ideonella sp. 4Y11]|uniref:biotin--[biotin carboxyl-carrier protein] ligase n=1 Tax=Ideonella aquatica TaxID=2824119 RepID=A0A940YMD4_9BURK|nr:biotin--[acetyl-CoA-carboxylase] ligase [Ideonella aquatica]MBQ0961262.1 biotin--[acetyl-CoA-carboxylase] ligase [Ideonella aquatica]
MQDWRIPELRAALAAHWPGLVAEALPEIGSTSTELLQRAREAGAAFAPCLLVAERQSAGRGRLGRQWQSGVGDALTFSLAVPLARADWSGLSLAVGVALAEAIDPANAWLRLKWPNDLWLADGRKLGGILVEGLPLPQGPRVAVVGVGLNLRAPADAALQAAGLADVAPGLDAPALLARVAPTLAAALRRFDAQGFGAFADAFATRDVLMGRAIRTTDPALPGGLADGVDADGALRLRCDGRVQRIVSGEVSVRPD